MDGPVFVVADHCRDDLVLRHQLGDERASHHHAFVLKSLMCISLKRRVVVLDVLAHFSSIHPPSYLSTGKGMFSFHVTLISFLPS